MSVQFSAGFLLLVLLGAAVACDWRHRRIPNRLVLAGLLAGLAANLFLPRGGGLFMPDAGGIGWAASALGAVLGGALLLPLWLLRSMGAGDVKLMAAVGAFLGPWQAVGAVLLTALAGGLLALSVAVFSGALLQVWGNLRLMLLCLVVGKGGGVRIGDVATTGRLPYALAIATGCMLQILLVRVSDWPFV